MTFSFSTGFIQVEQTMNKKDQVDEGLAVATPQGLPTE